MANSIEEFFPKSIFSRQDVETVGEERRQNPIVESVEISENAENWIMVTTFKSMTEKALKKKKRASRSSPGKKAEPRKGRNPANSGDWFSVARVEPVNKIGGRGQTGWRPSPPDMRDFSAEERLLEKNADPRAHRLSNALTRVRKGERKKLGASLPRAVDISQWCAEVEQQGNIGSCTAHAVVGLVEYFNRKMGDQTFHGSRLFVYKATRRLAEMEGDSGAYIRSALGAVVLCGTPPEKNWPYSDADSKWDVEPDSFIYSLAQNFQARSYFRYDTNIAQNDKRKQLLHELKEGLVLELPFAFGFYGFPSFDAAVNPGDMPFPSDTEKAEWGHAIMAVGYDDSKKIIHPWTDEVSTGAFKIRNSWGVNWGEDGYGWLPYDYVLHGLADDFWSIVDMEWLETRGFDV